MRLTLKYLLDVSECCRATAPQSCRCSPSWHMALAMALWSFSTCRSLPVSRQTLLIKFHLCWLLAEHVVNVGRPLLESLEYQSYPLRAAFHTSSNVREESRSWNTAMKLSAAHLCRCKSLAFQAGSGGSAVCGTPLVLELQRPASEASSGDQLPATAVSDVSWCTAEGRPWLAATTEKYVCIFSIERCSPLHVIACI